MSDHVCVWIDNTLYFVAPETARKVEPRRYLCQAWKHGPDGELREVQNLGRLDILARLMYEANKEGSYGE